MWYNRDIESETDSNRWHDNRNRTIHQWQTSDTSHPYRRRSYYCELFFWMFAVNR